jgi:hypothetical protein
MISLLIGSSHVFRAQAYSDEGCHRKRSGEARELATTAGMQAARQLLEA